MKKMIVNVKTERTDYDPRYSHDGGSYYQPLITVLFDDGRKVVIDDLSCGDFGTRIYAAYYAADGSKLAACSYGSMEPDNQWSTFQVEHAAVIEMIAAEIGYRFPTAEEVQP